MKYEVFFPPHNLKGIVKHFIVINSLKDVNKLLFLPTGGNFLVFNRGIKASIQSFCDKNIARLPLSYSISAKSDKVNRITLDNSVQNEPTLPLILVELLPLGFFRLFNQDSSALRNKHIKIDEKIINKYFSKLYKHNNINEELKYLSNSLSQMIKVPCGNEICISDVVEKIHNEYFDVKVQDLLNDFDCSRSTMERHFKQKVGLTPKNYILVAKFYNTLVEYVQKKKTFHDLQYIYSDNSHMNATFKKFLGITPSEILSRVNNKEFYIYQINNLKLEKLMNSY